MDVTNRRILYIGGTGTISSACVRRSIERGDHVTVLNLGRVLATGAPSEIRVHKEVVSAYLGG